jgi:hypothetical protein
MVDGIVTMPRTTLRARVARLIFLPAALAALLPASRAGAQTGAQANAQECGDRVYAALGRHLHVEDMSPQAEGGAAVAAACKVWPADPSILLAAVAYDAGVEYHKTLLVAMLDRRTLRIRRSWRGDFEEDAVDVIGEHSLVLDTGRYALGDSARAFGLRFETAGRQPSLAEGYGGDELTLFAPAGTALRPVMWFVPMSRDIKLDEERWSYAKLTLDVGQTRSRGLADLLVSARIETDAGEDGKREAPHVERRTLRYDGTRYRVQPGAKGEPAPWWWLGK